MVNWNDMTGKERNKYINQDQVPLREFVGLRGMSTVGEDKEWPNCKKSNERIIYEMYILDDRSIDDILFHVNLTEEDIKFVINKLTYNFRNKKNKRIKRILENHFVHKKKVVWIAKKEKVAHSYVSKIIGLYLLENKIT